MGRLPTRAFAGRSKPSRVTQGVVSGGQGASIDETGAPGFDAQEHVLGDRQLRYERELLCDEGDAMLQRLSW